MHRPAILTFLLGAACLSPASAEIPPAAPWRELLLARTEVADSRNALARWRSSLPEFFPEDRAIGGLLEDLSSPLADASKPEALPLKAWLAGRMPALSTLVIRDGEFLQLPRIQGPETPLPDHQPLRQLALVRVAAMKVTWDSGHCDEALALALDNLALARALLRTQEGLIPLIVASGVWQISLDGVYWLARQPELTAAQATRLQSVLLHDDRLATDALIRGFRGEFTFFTHLVVERLPQTRDVDLLLSGIASLGMTPPEPPAEGELHLTVATRDPLDREATLQAAADDVRAWIDAFSARSRHPQGFSVQHTQARLTGYAKEIPALGRYATQDAPATPEQITAVNAEIAAVENPVGKLFLIFTTSYWESLSVSVFRREAQRSALTGLLAWRRLGRPGSWKEVVTAGLLAWPPADPFSNDALRCNFKTRPRVWSVGLNGTDEKGEGAGENTGQPDDFTWPAAP